MASPPPAHIYPPLSQGAINLAFSEMPLVEFEAWQYFTSPAHRNEIFTLENIMLEAPIDWDNTASIASPFSEDSIAIASRRIKGLNYLYNTTKARLIHADWYAANYAETWLPVVEAVGRVLIWDISLKNGSVKESVIVDRSISTVLTEEGGDTIPMEKVPIVWKSYNIAAVPMAVVPPFDPLALKHALVELCDRQGRPGPEHKAYLAFTAGNINASTLARDCPIDWDMVLAGTKLGRNVKHNRGREHGVKQKKGRREGENSTLTRMKRMAEALSFLYQSERVTPRHAFWWWKRYMDTEGGKLAWVVMRICQMERALDVRPNLR